MLAQAFSVSKGCIDRLVTSQDFIKLFKAGDIAHIPKLFGVLSFALSVLDHAAKIVFDFSEKVFYIGLWGYCQKNKNNALDYFLEMSQYGLNICILNFVFGVSKAVHGCLRFLLIHSALSYRRHCMHRTFYDYKRKCKKYNKFWYCI